jgi:radical SAM superfamily enzyme YgiQ (UPF0313 family)
MEIGVLELLTDTVQPARVQRIYDRFFRRHYASIAPQAVAAWCRRQGHRVHYATWYGQRRPDQLLPCDLDVVFLATYTQASPLAYALARLYRRQGVRTVLGGPHARAFPRDAARFFDLVVHDCDPELVADILSDGHAPGSVVTSGRSLREIPGVEERMPEIRVASFHKGRPERLGNIALLTSIGCPYRCDFCSDWDSPYTLLPKDRLRADLAYISRHFPGMLVSFHDPNFGVRFDEVLEVLEELPPERRNPYLMESSLSILRSARLERLRETRCVYAAPGVESWGDYSNKAGVGRTVGRAKLEDVIEHFQELFGYVPGLQANFIFGTDGDRGDEPAALTREFIRRTPFVWPTLNIPVPFGGTPLHDRYRAEGRILESMPFAFYYLPYLVIRIRHYDPAEYYEKLIRLFGEVTASRVLLSRLQASRGIPMGLLNLLRTAAMWLDLRGLREIHRELERDAGLRAFHEGRTRDLPPLYREHLRRRLGPFAELLDEEDLTPVLEPVDAVVGAGNGGPREVRYIGHAAVAAG